MSIAKRFQSIEEALNMSSLEESEIKGELPSTEDVVEALEQAKNLEKQFIKMDHYDTHDKEMDELAGLAVQAHKDLQELGMNVEIRHAGEIFNSSSQMLKIAVEAKNNKVDKKLRLLKLQLEKLKIDKVYGDNDDIDGTVVKLDRNELMKQLKQINDK
jgi:RNase P/RNase MRP subunit p29